MDFSGYSNRPEIRSVADGRPITREEAQDLRMTLYGSTIHSFSSEFRRGAFVFQGEGGPFPFGLATQRNGTRGTILCVQGYVIRHLVFKYDSREEIYRRDVLHPSDYQRREALISAISQMLWQAGEGLAACVCLMQTGLCFEPDSHYRKDNITETLHLYEFQNYDELRLFVKKNIDFFEGDRTHGVILFLYSLVMSRTIKKIQDDHGGEKIQLLTDNEDLTWALVNLMLTGRAVQYLHNGNVMYDEEGQLLESDEEESVEPQKGVKDRSEIGLLYWHRDQGEKCKHMVGSMLKTPKRPVWLSHVNGQWGLIFTLNPDLVSDWRSEHKFTLHYYNGLASQGSDVTLTIDTRVGRQFQSKTLVGKREEEKRVPALEKALMTKWYGCSVNWNGTTPFV